MYFDTANFGVVLSMHSVESFELKKISENEYAGVFYSDMSLDEDDYNKGLCKWSVTAVSVIFANTFA